jgi:hypothetical protein
MKVRRDNEMAITNRTRRLAEQTDAPQAEFYATIKGPNYDNIWVTHDNFGTELKEQIKDNNNFVSERNFYGMSDEELLMNK